MSRYTEWLAEQDELFINEICIGKEPQQRFKDYNKRPITLEELKKLDEEFILSLTVSNA